MAAAVVSAVLVLAAPAAAVDGVPDNPAAQPACSGPYDVNGDAQHAVRCLESLGVATGPAEAAFAFSRPVRRWAMAWALVNAAEAAGADVPAPTDQGFTDIADLSQGTQDVINQLAALNITKGTSEGVYSPHGTVTRMQMALFFTRLLAVAPTGPGGTPVGDVSPDDTVFTDTAGLGSEAQRAIGVIYELGITRGTTATTFAPHGEVNGAQMALFLTRLLGHSPARAPLAEPRIAYRIPHSPNAAGISPHELWTVGADGSDPVRIAGDNHGVATRGAAWSPDGTRIAYATAEGSFRASSGAALSPLWVAGADGDNPTRVADIGWIVGWSPDGSRIFYGVHQPRVPGDLSAFNRELWSVGADGADLTRLSRDGGADSRIEGWSPDGARVAYHTRFVEAGESRLEFWIADIDGANATRLSDASAFFGWSPDGSRVAYAIEYEGPERERCEQGPSYRVCYPYYALWTADPDGANPTHVVDDVWAYSWSPDGRYFAYYHADALWVSRADGTNPTRLADRRDGCAPSSFLGWSADGTLAYESIPPPDSPANSEVRTVSADGAHTRVLTDNAYWGPSSSGTLRDGVYSPIKALSPDGNRIVYVSATALGGYEQWVVDLDGANPTRLLGHSGTLDDWSPDARYVAYTGGTSRDLWDTDQVWIVGADGTSPTKLTDKGRFAGWSPDSARVAYAVTTDIRDQDEYDPAPLGELWTADPNGAHPTKLADHGRFVSWPAR